MSNDVQSQTSFPFGGAEPVSAGGAVMRYFCVVNRLLYAGQVVTADPVELVSVASEAILKQTGRSVIAGMLGRNAWKKVWRQVAPIGKESRRAPPFLMLPKVCLVRDRLLNDEVFECYVSDKSFYRRLSQLPNAAKLIGPSDETIFRKQIDLFG